MGKFDLSGQPPWLVSLTIVLVGFVVPIALALIGKWRGGRREEPERVERAERIEVTTPWLVQNLLEIKMNVENIKHAIDALTAAVNAAAIQINNIASKQRRDR